MATGDDSRLAIDERGDLFEVLLWGSVFLFTLVLFVYEFGLGMIEIGDPGLLPAATIADFERTMWLSGLIGGGGVVALIVFAVFRYGSGVRTRAEPLRPRQGMFAFAVFLLAVSVVVGTTVFTGAATLAQTDEATVADAAERHGVDREVEMSATAAQWFWRFDVQGVPNTQAERVVLPADTIIQFQTTSADVIHSFSIKHLGVTKDAMPGQMNQAWFYVADTEGETEITFIDENDTKQTVAADTYQVRCAELCGKGHSKMIATIYVVSPEHYEMWVHAQGGENPFSEPDSDFTMKGTESSGGHDESGDDHEEEENGGGH